MKCCYIKLFLFLYILHKCVFRYEGDYSIFFLPIWFLKLHRTLNWNILFFHSTVNHTPTANKNCIKLIYLNIVLSTKNKLLLRRKSIGFYNYSLINLWSNVSHNLTVSQIQFDYIQTAVERADFATWFSQIQRILYFYILRKMSICLYSFDVNSQAQMLVQVPVEPFASQFMPAPFLHSFCDSFLHSFLYKWHSRCCCCSPFFSSFSFYYYYLDGYGCIKNYCSKKISNKRNNCRKIWKLNVVACACADASVVKEIDAPGNLLKQKQSTGR